MRTMKEALAAKDAMKHLLRGLGVAASCGVTQTPAGDLAVKVNLTTARLRSNVPNRIADMPVVVEVIGPVRAVLAGRRG